MISNKYNKMPVNKSASYTEAKNICNVVTHNIFKDYKDKPKREITYEEACDDVEYMVQIHQLIEEMIKRRDSRLLNANPT